ncbi:MAG TPA: type II secretion system protein N [Limnobacter sp.]|nr:type II secretion system protein N [Limnobacter sp.]
MKFSLKRPVALHALVLHPGVLRALQALLWALAVALLVWVLIGLFAPSPTLAPAMPSQATASFQVDQSPEARLLGVETTGGLTPPAVNLLGVFAGESGQGAAVMSIDGQPAQSRRVGDEVANGWMLEEVGPTFAVLRRSGQRHQVDLPKLQADPNLLQRVPG